MSNRYSFSNKRIYLKEFKKFNVCVNGTNCFQLEKEKDTSASYKEF